ncbi:MAG: hypothetical protein ACOYOS_16770 [Syntrophales bacterium]
MNFWEGVHFVGAGDDGNRTAIELSRIYEGLRDGLFYEEHDEPQNHLHIHSFPFAETGCFEGNYDSIIILAGAVHDPCWQEARETLNEGKPYFMLTIGIDSQRGIGTDSLQPFPDECLIFPDPSFFEPVEQAKLVLQIFFMHMPWSMSERASIAALDAADTKTLFAGKVTKVRKIALDKEHYRQNFSKYLSENNAEFSRIQGMLIILWITSLHEFNALSEDIEQLLKPDVNSLYAVHALPEDEPDIMATLFYTL